MARSVLQVGWGCRGPMGNGGRSGPEVDVITGYPDAGAWTKAEASVVGGTDLRSDCGDGGWGESRGKDSGERVITPGSGQVTRQSTDRAVCPAGSQMLGLEPRRRSKSAMEENCQQELHSPVHARGPLHLPPWGRYGGPCEHHLGVIR